jgi:hypothetical protein
MRGERDLTLAAAERICLALHLKLAPYSPRARVAAPGRAVGREAEGAEEGGVSAAAGDALAAPQGPETS